MNGRGEERREDGGNVKQKANTSHVTTSVNATDSAEDDVLTADPLTMEKAASDVAADATAIARDGQAKAQSSKNEADLGDIAPAADKADVDLSRNVLTFKNGGTQFRRPIAIVRQHLWQVPQLKIPDTNAMSASKSSTNNPSRIYLSHRFDG